MGTRLLRALVPAALWLQAPAAAQAPISAPASYEPVQELAEAAREAPVEVFADVGFDLIGRRKFRLQDRRKLLEEVFRRAAEARQPLPLVYAGREPAPALAHAAAEGYRLGVDGLSLRCRAVQLMLPMDPGRALELFREIPHVPIPKPACDSRFVPAAGVYLETLAAIVERRAQAPWRMLEAAVRRISSSWEVVTAATVLPPLARDGKQAEALAKGLTAALGMADSDRGFTSAAVKGNLVSRVLAASAKLRAQGVDDTPLLAALRSHLVRHLEAERCEDTAREMPAGIEEFNAAVRGRAGLGALPADPGEPPASGEKAPPRPAVAADEFARLSTVVTRLAGVQPGQNIWQVRLTPEWDKRAREALSRIQEWKGAPAQDPLEVFHQKLSLLWRLYEAAPAGPTRDALLARIIATLEDGAILQRDPAAWITGARRLVAYQRLFSPEALRALRTGPPDLQMVASQSGYQTGFEIVEAVAAARLPALALYGRAALLDRP